MLLHELGEFGFIDRIAAAAAAHPQLVVGIGDDAAILDLGGPELTVVSTDGQFEGHHFRLDCLAPREIGWRAAAAALSDLAAMGARPVAVFCTCALPPAWAVDSADELLGGVAEAAASAGAVLAGGDLVANDQVALDVVVVGSVPRGQALLRTGARPGQVLAVTGTLGATGAALAVVQAAGPQALAEMPELRARFARPCPRLAAGRALAAAGYAAAGMDISDGLVQDAGHIARNSGVRLIIEAARIPIAPGCAQAGRKLGRDPLSWALSGGEDFELLVALAPAQVEAALSLEEVAAVGLTVVGRVEEGAGVCVLGPEGGEIDLARGGWDHFA